MDTGIGSTSGAKRQNDTQYQHFILRFLLRQFASPVARRTLALRRNGAKYGKHQDKDGQLNTINLSTSRLENQLVSKHFGLEDMYRDPSHERQRDIEEEPSKLESHAATIINKARNILTGPESALELDRSQRNDLQKFLFLMKYRNLTSNTRYDCDSIEAYGREDKAGLAKYMIAKGYSSPRDVWLTNLRAFLDVDIDPQGEWTKHSLRDAYYGDAMLFILHVQSSFLAFCRPVLSSEFLLSENVYGIFEGPAGMTTDIASGKESFRLYTEWYNFAPISPSLIILLRSNFLPGGDQSADGDSIARLYDELKNQHMDPEHAGSVLEDLPVARPQTVYASEYLSSADDFTQRDVFRFQCHGLASHHIQTINTIMLEEAYRTSTIVYKSPLAAANTIRAYLEDQRDFNWL